MVSLAHSLHWALLVENERGRFVGPQRCAQNGSREKRTLLVAGLARRFWRGESCYIPDLEQVPVVA